MPAATTCPAENAATTQAVDPPVVWLISGAGTGKAAGARRSPDVVDPGDAAPVATGSAHRC
ncbi:hypothetical protein DL991_26975 [Amycolatopsis sp. WAC 01375]|uniref:hypothetical protein n=1 Tax=Amycolatopsis sp. WAC 01375 TaxID=2203194 RepID=UPI000F786F58|nr:hypothetical protein [Amycolatopsis sp. WAC 01375]RSM75727.1 hypothetical protein DL991_26975 [Amycolatopsis sp. WAC 01375]